LSRERRACWPPPWWPVRIERSIMATDREVARLGLLKFIAKQGGSIPIQELHTHSLLFYQAGHQAFSQLMEGLTEDELVRFDDERVFHLTDKGQAFLETQRGEGAK